MVKKIKSIWVSLPSFPSKKLLTPALMISLLLHVVVFIFVFGGFDFWKKPDHIKEVAVKAVFLPDTKPDEVERIAKRDPIPPPPPPPPPPPKEAAKPKPVPQAEPAPPPPPEPPKQAEETPLPPPVPVPPEEVANAEDFSKSILKTLEEVQEQPPQGEELLSTAPPQAVSQENLQPQSLSNDDSVLSADEIDALRSILAECWSVSAGTREIANLRVAVKLSLERDGRIIQAEVVDKSRFKSDAFFRVAAEDALRALHHPKCQRLPLPSEKYKSWKVIIFEFDPQEMLG